MTDSTWTNGGGDGKVSTVANWSNGIGAGYNLIFDATSTASCSFDYTATLGNIFVNAGYTGTITQTANISAHDITIAGAATITFSTSYWVFLSGSYLKSAGTLTGDKLQLEMTGDGETISSNNYSAQSWNKLKISNNITLLSSIGVKTSLEVITGKVLTINSGKVVDSPYQLGGATPFSLIAGQINGLGEIDLYIYNYNKALDLTNIHCGLQLYTDWSGGTTYKYILSADVPNLLFLKVNERYGGSRTTTLDTAGYDVVCATTTIYALSTLTDSVGGTIITGNVVVNGATAILSQGANCLMVINGNLTLTLGTVNQLGKLVLIGANSQGGGTFNSNKDLWILGSYAKTSGTFNFTGTAVQLVYGMPNITCAITGGSLVCFENSSVLPASITFTSGSACARDRRSQKAWAYGTIAHSDNGLKPETGSIFEVVSGTYTVDSSFRCRKLIIDSGATLVQAADKRMCVVESIVNEGTFTKNTLKEIVTGKNAMYLNTVKNQALNPPLIVGG